MRRSINRRSFLYGVGALAAKAFAAEAPAQPLAFLALGDWGREGARFQLPVARGMARAAADLGSRFVISAGDNFYPSGVASARDPQWLSSFEAVYTEPSLQTPWLAALGNHDYRGEPQAQVQYARTSSRWRMPDRYYAIERVAGADLDLFVLDTTPLVDDYGEAFVRLCRGHISTADPSAQLRWFRNRLGRSKATWKVVVGHHPIHSGGRHGGEPALVDAIEPLLEAHGVQVYINGHDHALQHIRTGLTHHVCSGAGCSAGDVEDVPGMRFRASQPGFAAFRLEPAGLRLEFRGADGASLYEADLAA